MAHIKDSLCGVRQPLGLLKLLFSGLEGAECLPYAWCHGGPEVHYKQTIKRVPVSQGPSSKESASRLTDLRRSGSGGFL